MTVHDNKLFKTAALTGCALTMLLGTGQVATAATPADVAPPTAAAQQKLKATVADRIQYFGGGTEPFSYDIHPAIDQNGDVYFVNKAANKITQLSPGEERTNYTFDQFASGDVNAVRAITVDPDGTIWAVAALRDNSLALYHSDSDTSTMTGVVKLNQNRVINSMAINPVTNQIFVSTDSCISRLGADGGFTEVVGGIFPGFSGDGGPADKATLNWVAGFTFDSKGNIYIADTENNRIRYVDAKSNIITTIAGNGFAGFAGDGQKGTDASLNGPNSVTVDPAGNVIVTDSRNDRIRMLDGYRTITTVVGSGIVNDPLRIGAAAPTAALHSPDSVMLAPNGSLVFTSALNLLDQDRSKLFVAEPLPVIELGSTPLPAYVSPTQKQAKMKPRGDDAGRKTYEFNFAGLNLTPNEDGTKYVGNGKHTFTSVGSPVTITAGLTEYWATSPVEFSNLLLLRDVTFSQVVNGVTYASHIDSLSLAYETGFGQSYVATTPPNPMPWGDFVIPDLKDNDGNVSPTNKEVAGAWIMQVGLTAKPVFTPAK